MAKRALITGVSGQDGAYLAELLLGKGYEVFGLDLSTDAKACWRLHYLGIYDKVSLVEADMADAEALLGVVKRSSPGEIYNLAAHSAPGTSFQNPVECGDVTGLGLARLLEVARQAAPQARIFQASTRELFGPGDGGMYNEDQSFRPSNPYAAAKLYAHWMAKIYRDSYGMYVCNGIMFNHESPLRGIEFVTRKITDAAARISLGQESRLALGNTGAKIDWGYAPEYMQAAWLMLQQPVPDDYVIATGEAHSVEEFARRAFEIVGLNWRAYVEADAGLLRPSDIVLQQGDYSKAEAKLGWQPQVKFGRLVEIMVEEDLARWKRSLKGEQFPWDVR
ncbi:MAG: GDP-mannose 4,6-dehydratase [Dehalococcoidia bacterium]|nr:MAG: GDP-mannose 4,6-dehydratase [Dehalococcoidia bacterium]